MLRTRRDLLVCKLGQLLQFDSKVIAEVLPVGRIGHLCDLTDLRLSCSWSQQVRRRHHSHSFIRHVLQATRRE